MIPKNVVLNFELSAVEVDKDKYNKFAVVSVDVATDGDNLNHILFTPESIESSADSLVDSPLLVDMKWGRATTHSKDEKSVGFFKYKEDINFAMKNGKRWLCSKAYIWKQYATDLIEYLQQNNGKLPVSMEVRVNETAEIDGEEWVTSFDFVGVTILGATVQEAIVGANMQVLSFAQLKDEFDKEEIFCQNKYATIDFSVPEKVKENVDKSLGNYFKNKLKISNYSLDIAKALSEEKVIGFQHAENIKRFFEQYKLGNFADTEVYNLYGGEEADKWVFSLFEQMSNIDKKEKEESKPVKKDKKDIEKKEEDVEKLSEEGAEEDKNKEEFEEDKDKIEEKADEKADKEEKEVEDDDEDDKDDTTDMSNNINADASAETELLKKETDENEKLANKTLDAMFAELLDKEEFAEKEIAEMAEEEEDTYFEAVTKELGKFACVDEERFAKLDDKQKTALACKMAKVCEMAKNANSVYMSKKKDLSKFKCEFEEKTKKEKVDFALFEIKEDVTKEQLDELRECAKQFSFAELNTWENMVKAKAYEFAKQKNVNKDDNEKNKMKTFAWASVETDSSTGGLKW